MTSIAAATTRTHGGAASVATAPRRPGLRDAPWVRASLGVAIAGLLVADLSIVLRERADAAAAGRGPAPALESEGARDAAARFVAQPAAAFDAVGFDEAVGRAVDAAAPAPTEAVTPVAAAQVDTPDAVPAAATVTAPTADVPVAVVPRVPTPGAAGPQSSAPPAPPTSPLAPFAPPGAVPPIEEATSPIVGLIESVPVAGPALAPTVETVVAEVAPVVDDLTGAAPSQTTSATAAPTTVDAVVDVVTAPAARPAIAG